MAYAAEEACSRGCDCEVIDVMVADAASRIALNPVMGMREVTNWQTEEKRTDLWRLQRRACHDRVVVILLAGTEVSVDWERFPHLLRVRREVGVRRSLSTRLFKKTLAATAHRAGFDGQVAGVATTHWTDALSLLQCL